MVSLGVVRVDRQLETTFKAQFAPISTEWVPEALAVSGIDRQTHESYPFAGEGMAQFFTFLEENNLGGGRPLFVSDNPAFDWQFVNYYFHRFIGSNKFGFSARRIGDFYAGLERDFGASNSWKKFRKTAHTHDPVDDARGNVEALIHIADKHGVKIPGL